MWWRGLDLRFKARSFLTARQPPGTESRTAARARNMESLSNLTPYYTWLGPHRSLTSIRIKYRVCGGNSSVHWRIGRQVMDSEDRDRDRTEDREQR